MIVKLLLSSIQLRPGSYCHWKQTENDLRFIAVMTVVTSGPVPDLPGPLDHLQSRFLTVPPEPPFLSDIGDYFL